MTYQEQAHYFKILAHPVRLQILDLLRQGEVCVCHIEVALQKRQAYISQQLMILRDMNVVTTRKNGLQVYYRISDPQMLALLQLLNGEADKPDVLSSCPCPNCNSEVNAHVNR